MALLTVMKALPLAYNKDMQEDKEPLFDTIDTVKGSLKIFADMIREMKIKADIMREAAARGFSNATDVADYLVRTGMPFREAHEVVGKSVRYCIEHGKEAGRALPGRMAGLFRPDRRRHLRCHYP
ncbi:MAG: hypothetical protein MZV65_20735 [Chromatiales bacterium]|nr:hypothetical protein [Chromatiales bacterium]